MRRKDIQSYKELSESPNILCDFLYYNYESGTTTFGSKENGTNGRYIVKDPIFIMPGSLPFGKPV
jgi:hypothetical protein